MNIPQTHRALVCKGQGNNDNNPPLQLQTLPILQPTPGSALIRIAAAPILPYHRDIYSGSPNYPLPTPLTGGFSALGHVVSVGPDATSLKPSQLVYFDCVVRARDDPDASFLSAIFQGVSAGGNMLMREAWRDGSFAEYARVPLENCIPLDEKRLCAGPGMSAPGGRGSTLGCRCSIPELGYMAYLLIPFGGLWDIQVQPGETVVVCPATGFYSGFAVQVAVAMGARVIAMGRSGEKLALMKEEVERRSSRGRVEVETVVISGDEEADMKALRAFGAIDAVLDITPQKAAATATPTHIRSAIRALRPGGRVSLMGSTVGIDVSEIMVNSITLKGKFMYDRQTIVQFVKILERGLLPMGDGLVDTKTFALEDWKEALDVAAEHSGIGKCVVFTP